MVVAGVTGLLVPAGSPGDLAAALRRLLTDPVRAAAMGREGRGRAEAEFDLGRAVGQYERLYTDLARESGCLPAAFCAACHRSAELPEARP
jgi:glycosyltransferase involved in cell wall biosynthesis